MRDTGDIALARLIVLQAMNDGVNVPEHGLQICSPLEQTKPVIIELCWRRYVLCYKSSRKATQLLDQELKRREELDGRVIDPIPVRLNHGITETAKVIQRFEVKIDRIESQIKSCCELTDFNSEGNFDHLCRKWLRLSRNLRDRTEIYLQSLMWTQWTIESLYQASEIASYLVDDNSRYFTGFEDDFFSYLAHPPLFVSLMTVAAMIEEVGAYALKELAGTGPIEETSLHDVLQKLQSEGLFPSNLDLGVLDEDLVNKSTDYDLRSARNDLAHSMTARGKAVTVENIGKYIQVVEIAISLVHYLADKLAKDVMLPLGRLNLVPSNRRLV